METQAPEEEGIDDVERRQDYDKFVSGLEFAQIGQGDPEQSGARDDENPKRDRRRNQLFKSTDPASLSAVKERQVSDPQLSERSGACRKRRQGHQVSATFDII